MFGFYVVLGWHWGTEIEASWENWKSDLFDTRIRKSYIFVFKNFMGQISRLMWYLNLKKLLCLCRHIAGWVRFTLSISVSSKTWNTLNFAWKSVRYSRNMHKFLCDLFSRLPCIWLWWPISQIWCTGYVCMMLTRPLWIVVVTHHFTWQPGLEGTASLTFFWRGNEVSRQRWPCMIMKVGRIFCVDRMNPLQCYRRGEGGLGYIRNIAVANITKLAYPILIHAMILLGL